MCGDGYQRDGVETCDQGPANGEYGGGCNLTCDGPGPRCGDGVVDPMHEQCDGDGGDHSSCDACQLGCDNGYGDCNASPGDGCETFLVFDKNNCGKCGNKCSKKQSCAGVCIP